MPFRKVDQTTNIDTYYQNHPEMRGCIPPADRQGLPWGAWLHNMKYGQGGALNASEVAALGRYGLDAYIVSKSGMADAWTLAPDVPGYSEKMNDRTRGTVSDSSVAPGYSVAAAARNVSSVVESYAGRPPGDKEILREWDRKFVTSAPFPTSSRPTGPTR